MKTLIHLSLITALIIGLGASPAKAGDDEALAALGGFVAGIITGAVIDDDDGYRHKRVHVYRDRHDRYGHRDKGYRHDRGNHRKGDRCDYRGGNHRKGHWEIKRVRVWVPGYWKVIRDRCGDRVKIWKRGHYEWRREKVWVSYGGRGHHRRYRD